MTEIQIAPVWLILITSGVLPLLVAWWTAQRASATVKSLVLVALAAVSGFLAELQAAGGDFGTFDWSISLTNAVLMFLGAVTAHFELLRRAGITGSEGAIQKSSPGGLGG